ncbi:hypothetical protein CFE70_006595 [Pyrenophora teres f. teres 0-1]|uniref:5'-3' DNA helicase ZGRF1-like N-terminal domain-containing protein n=1 Tax=Pyrenophora teres f. teres (strain 0-1) TaxID=861557 RepID=E3S4T8_PYRTT|nr:hypothetical protein PTT_17621 [Pyrenophora teres f. teres 0-1]KAE8828219.1 hypothetical protein HRS9139_07438 [Pyrenophora teres f. teres]KAE8830818.1 hypothetical protein PTNB85_07405 [Pyrenophora teres f. teres]KAE8857184.1 hypothetical protein PTNB29_08251 [Pyrenophora teres f. teres]
MTAPLRNTQHASAIAAITASQNTAPVAEFRCLFTQDIKRKQKRWQDGYLKFHTFNNRVMVYDQARNFLGDTYYKDSNELQEGDELHLNNGALVEVAEAMDITHTDLTLLLEKKNKEAPPRPSAPSQSKPFQRPSSVAPTNAQRNGSQLRHKSLNTLLGTPKGPIGKAQPIKSPYDARKEKETDKEKENEVIEERAPKRQKAAQAPPAWRASSPAQEESPAARSRVQVQARKPTKFIPPTATVITIDSEPDPHPAFLSVVSMPDTPPKATKPRAERRQLATPAPQPVSRQPLAKTPRIPKGKVPVPSVRALETPKQRAPPSSPPVSACNRLSNVDFAIQVSKEPPKEPTPPKDPEPPIAPLAGRKPKSLRLTAGVKRGRLLCQAFAQQAPTVAASKVKPRTASRRPSKEPSLARNQENDSASRSRVSASKRASADAEDVAPKRVRMSKSPVVPSSSLCEDPEVIHGRMDQQLLVTSSPVQVQVASSPPVEVSKPKPIPVKKVASKKAVVPKPPEAIVPQSKSLSPKPVPRKAQARKKAVDKSTPAPPPAPVLDAPRPSARDVSPTHTEPSEVQSRAPAAKRSKKQPVTKNSTTDAATPPHPLRANKNGPLMSTTELAGILQQPKNLAKALADPIEDEGNALGNGKSSNRNFRRVRSENDAPIPSISEEWEKRNLPKPQTDTVDEAQQSGSAAVTAEAVAEVPKKQGGLSALIKRTDPRRRFKRTQSLHVDTSSDLPETMVEVECPSPVVDVDIGPWSTEAGDLFDWRPPGREKK